MQDLIAQERFEIEVLDYLNSQRFLNRLIFCGGTMLRLCWGLNRFSVDLDFWLAGQRENARLFSLLKAALSQRYSLEDASNKFFTLLFEIKSAHYQRSLKIEIRKDKARSVTEESIAFSRFSETQVRVKAATLAQMMRAKQEALLNRKEIRDAFDIEFLLRKGVTLDVNKDDAGRLMRVIAGFGKKDYSVKLGSLLDAADRAYYARENFKFLQSKLMNADTSV